jgi:hypothetical protein
MNRSPRRWVKLINYMETNERLIVVDEEHQRERLGLDL